MTATQSIRTGSDSGGNDVAEMLAMYQRLATMDPPALRSLTVEVERLSDESSSSAALQPTPPIPAKARRDAQRAAAARAVLASIESEP